MFFFLSLLDIIEICAVLILKKFSPVSGDFKIMLDDVIGQVLDTNSAANEKLDTDLLEMVIQML